MPIRTWSTCVKRLFVVGLFACLWLMPLRASAAPAQQALPPRNDNFADATPIGSIPWAATVTLDGATAEDGETAPWDCGAYTGVAYQTVWYSYTPQSTAMLVAYANYWPNYLAVYQGSSLADLQYIRGLTQLVPVRSANRTTAFDFTYTFTAADAQQGTMTFTAIATLIDHLDALQGDNTAISLPIKVSGAKAAAAGESAPVGNGLLFLPMVGAE